MPLYRIPCSVEHASGIQSWTVEADSPEEVLRLHKAGDSEFEYEEIEVTSLSEPRLEEVEVVEFIEE